MYAKHGILAFMACTGHPSIDWLRSQIEQYLNPDTDPFQDPPPYRPNQPPHSGAGLGGGSKTGG
jgi:hypothetical protein